MFFRDSFKCSEYTYKEVAYDGNFFKADFDKLLKKKDHLNAARTRVITEIASLDKHIKALQKA
jgi:hypothetical protein